jgi:hypothetical protein
MAGSTEWIIGFVKAAAWGTAVAVGAGDILKMESESVPEGIPDPIPDDNIGDSLSGSVYQGNVSLEGVINPAARFEGNAQRLLYMLMGEHTNQAGTPGVPTELEASYYYAHQAFFQPSNTGLFGTLAIDKNVGTDKIWEYPSAKPSQLELTHANGKCMLGCTMICDRLVRDSSVNTSAVLATVDGTSGLLIILNHLTFMITEVTGAEGNLDSGDEINITDMKLNINRNLAGDHETGSNAGYVGEPETNGMPEANIEFTVANYNSGNDALILDAQTIQSGRLPKIYKASLVWDGHDVPGATPGNNYKFQFDFPSLVITSAPASAGSPAAKVPVTIGLKVQTPSAASMPNGSDWTAFTAGTEPFRLTTYNNENVNYLA